MVILHSSPLRPQNLLKNCHHGIRQCTRCERKYCQVKIRGQVLGRHSHTDLQTYSHMPLYM